MIIEDEDSKKPKMVDAWFEGDNLHVSYVQEVGRTQFEAAVMRDHPRHGITPGGHFQHLAHIPELEIAKLKKILGHYPEPDEIIEWTKKNETGQLYRTDRDAPKVKGDGLQFIIK